MSELLTVSKMGGGRAAYYASLAAGEYYTEEGLSLDSCGYWLGTGAEQEGFVGKRVETKTFMNLFHGFSPDKKESWVYNAGLYKGTQRDRMPGYDLTVSAPKSVSICWALGSEEVRHGFEQAHSAAIAAMVEKIQERTIIRTGKGGRIKEAAGIMAAVFQHGTARQVDEKTLPDMQLHSHICVINTGISANGRHAALNGQDFLNKTFAKEYGAIYKAEFEKGIQAMGFETEKTKDSFEIKYVARELIEDFSKRGKQIEGKVSRATATAKEKVVANHRTRQAKGEYDPKELLQHWTTVAEQKHHFTSETINRLCRQWSAAEKKAEEAAGKKAEGVKPEPTTAAKAEPKITEKKVSEKRVKEARAPEFRVPEPKPQPEEKKGQTKTYSQREREAIAKAQQQYEQEGYKVIGATLGKREAKELTKQGLKSFTVRDYLRDAARKNYEEIWKHTRPERSAYQIITFQNNFTPTGRKWYATYKYATGQWSRKTAKKYTGEYWKPTSKMYHEFLYMTHQISKNQRNFLNEELNRQARAINDKTIVILEGNESMRRIPRVFWMIDKIEAKGGKVVFSASLDLETTKEATVATIEKSPPRPTQAPKPVEGRQEPPPRQQEQQRERRM